MRLDEAIQHRTDPTAIKVLFEAVDAISRRLTGADLRQVRDDLVSTTLLKLLDANILAELTTEESVRKYMAKSYKNACEDARRRRKKDRERHADVDDNLKAPGSSEEPDPLEDPPATSEELRAELEKVTAWFFAEVAPTIIPTRAPREQGLETMHVLHRIAMGQTTLDELIASEVERDLTHEGPGANRAKIVRGHKARWYKRTERALGWMNQWLGSVDHRDVPQLPVLRRWIGSLPLSTR